MNYDNGSSHYDDPLAFYDADAPTPERKNKMAQIKLDYADLDNVAYIARLREITTAMAGNANFPGSAAKITALNTALTALETKNNAYEAGLLADKTRMTERDNARDASDEAARALVKSAENDTTDAAELQSGLWQLRSTTSTPVGDMPKPQNFAATGGDQSGEVDLQWQPIKGRKTYVAEYATNPNGPWTQCYVGTKSTCSVTGLNPGALYYFHVRAKNVEFGPWSDLAEQRAS